MKRMVLKKGRTLSDEEVKRVQKVVRQLLARPQTQAELAKKIGFSQSQVSAVASGKRPGLSVFFAINVAREAGISPSELVDMNIEITPATMPEMSVKAFLTWLYNEPGIMATVHRYEETTIQDLFRLREAPARGGEADPEQIHQHILQLREGPIGDVPHDLIDPDELLRRLPAAPDTPTKTAPIRRKRKRTP